MMAPAICVLREASARPAAFGIQFSARAASLTRCLTSSETLSGSLNARETVAVETLALRATSSSLTRPLPPRALFEPATTPATLVECSFGQSLAMVLTTAGVLNGNLRTELPTLMELRPAGDRTGDHHDQIGK